MSAATIIFTDIVGFSRKPTAEQRRLVNALTVEMIHELRHLLNPPMDNPSVLALPTGDGMALAFLHRANQPWNREDLFRLIIRIHSWAHEQSTNHSEVAVRVGVHVGPVELVTDINGKPNICGDTINYSQRVMDAANPRQTLFSDAAFREYIGVESPICVLTHRSDTVRMEFKGPIEVYAKHGLQILVYKVILDPIRDYWSNDDPDAKHLMLVTLTPLPKEVVGSFGAQVEGATQLAFIQLTGERVLKSLNEGTIKVSKELKRFWVFMPNPEVYSNLKLSMPITTSELMIEWIQLWKELLSKIGSDLPRIDLRLGLFNEIPFFGASFINWERPGGRIHVSPFIWNVAAPNSPGYDMTWIGKKPSSIYETYVDGLQYLQSHTTNELTKKD